MLGNYPYVGTQFTIALSCSQRALKRALHMHADRQIGQGLSHVDNISIELTIRIIPKMKFWIKMEIFRYSGKFNKNYDRNLRL